MNEDYRDILSALVGRQAKFLIVGAHALAAHGYPRATVDIDVPFKVAKQKLVDEFDRRYLEALLEAHDNNISAAARAAGIERMSIYKMIRRLGLDKTDGRDVKNGNGHDDDGDEESTDHQR